MKKYLELTIMAVACICLTITTLYLYRENQRQTSLINKVTPMLIEMDTTAYVPRALALEDSIKTEFIKYWLNDDTSK